VLFEIVRVPVVVAMFESGSTQRLSLFLPLPYCINMVQQLEDGRFVEPKSSTLFVPTLYPMMTNGSFVFTQPF